MMLNVTISCPKFTTNVVMTSPTNNMELPITTKCFADKSFIIKPVHITVKFDKNSYIFVANFTDLSSELSKIGENIILNVVANEILKIYNENVYS